MKYTKVGDAITAGEFDDHLDLIVAAIHARRRIIGQQKVAGIQPGDVVTIANTVKPALLAGARLRVTSCTGMRLVGTLMDRRGTGRRWQVNSTVRLPLSLIGEVRNDA